MVRNAIQMFGRVNELCDIAKSTRRSDSEIMNALNEATELTITKRIDPIKTTDRYSVQSVQRVRDELSPLIPTPAIGALASDIVPFPANYKAYLLLYVNVGNDKIYCQPTSYNQEGDLQQDPFGKPTDSELYYNECGTGLRVFHGTIALGNYELWYIKNPLVLSIGFERDKVIVGGALTNAVNYIAYDESIYNGLTYYPGEVVSGTGATLTSGTVILAATIISSELPSALQDEVCNLAVAILEGSTEDYNKKISFKEDADKY